MTRRALWCSALLCLLSTPSFTEEPVSQPSIIKEIVSMKLVNLKKQFVVVEYKEEQTLIHDKILEQEMKEGGVLIPPALRERFGGKTNVRLTDPEFQVAFKEVFCPNIFNLRNFEWQEI